MSRRLLVTIRPTARLFCVNTFFFLYINLTTAVLRKTSGLSVGPGPVARVGYIDCFKNSIRNWRDTYRQTVRRYLTKLYVVHKRVAPFRRVTLYNIVLSVFRRLVRGSTWTTNGNNNNVVGGAAGTTVPPRRAPDARDRARALQSDEPILVSRT